jgi:hypothetical protein
MGHYLRHGNGGPNGVPFLAFVPLQIADSHAAPEHLLVTVGGEAGWFDPAVSN